MKGVRAFTLRGGRVLGEATVDRDRVHVEEGRFSRHIPIGRRLIDVEGGWVFPGFINAHDHLHLNSLPPLTDLGMFSNSYRWIDAAQRRRAAPEMIAAEQVPADVRLWHGALKNLLSGVTTVVHHDPWEPLFERPDFPVRVPGGYGWCHSLGLSGASVASTMRYGPSLLESLHDGAAGQRHRGSEQSRWFIHLAEGTDDVAAAELSALDGLGALTDRTVLVHATGLRPSDLQRVREVGAWVVWCPSSNQALLGRTLDPRELAGARRLGLGTDSRLSGATDLFAELWVAAATGLLDGETLLRLVTCDAAQVIGQPDLGVIAAGHVADLVVIDCDAHELRDVLLSSTRADIALVMRDGQPLLADERFWPLMAALDEDIVRVRVDGRIKCCPRRVLGPAAASALEPGLEVLA